MTLWESYAQNSLTPSRPELVLLDRHLPDLLRSRARHVSMPARPGISLQRRCRPIPGTLKVFLLLRFLKGQPKLALLTRSWRSRHIATGFIHGSIGPIWTPMLSLEIRTSSGVFHR